MAGTDIDIYIGIDIEGEQMEARLGDLGRGAQAPRDG
jgi:hypothetical protein